jgi:hypothetical protein
LPLAVDLLIDTGSGLAYHPRGGGDDEITGGIDFHALSIFNRERDLFWVGAGCDDEVVLKAPLSIVVVHQIDAGIDAFIFYLGIARNVGPPLCRVVANKVVRHSRQTIDPDNTRIGIGPHCLHSYKGGFETAGLGSVTCLLKLGF